MESLSGLQDTLSTPTDQDTEPSEQDNKRETSHPHSTSSPSADDPRDSSTPSCSFKTDEGSSTTAGNNCRENDVSVNDFTDLVECEKQRSEVQDSDMSQSSDVIMTSYQEADGVLETVDAVPDFSQLPEFLWVKVFQLLSLADRCRLSRVSWLMNMLFHDSGVWREGTISFTKRVVHGYFYIARYKLSLTERDKKLTRKFGRFFRDVTLRVRGRPEGLESDTAQILSLLRKNWTRLEALTLDIGDREWGQKYQGVETMDLTLLQDVVSILKESTALKCLHVLHWPQSYLTDEESLQLREVLLGAECPKLRSLRLPRTSENGIQTLISPRDLAVEVVDKFRCLRHIHLPSDMLSDALFQAMVTSRYDDVRTLSVEVSGFWSTGLLDHLLSPLSWSILTAHQQDFQVSLTVSTDVPEFAFARFLVPEIPLTSITFDMNSHCYRKAFILLHQYFGTLRSFRCFSEPKDCELELLDMVRMCHRLQHLLFYGAISDYNVLKLAEAGNRRWGQLALLWKNIEKTHQRPTPFNLVSQSHVAHHSNDQQSQQGRESSSVKTEEEVKAEFCRQVSERVGFQWEPLMS